MSTVTRVLNETPPEGRRFFIKVLGRIEFEVDDEEYGRMFNKLFPSADSLADSLPLITSFDCGIVEGYYKDPMPEEVE